MKKADGSGARYAAIIGDDEAEAGQVTLKALRGMAGQVRVAPEEVAELVRGETNN